MLSEAPTITMVAECYRMKDSGKYRHKVVTAKIEEPFLFHFW